MVTAPHSPPGQAEPRCAPGLSEPLASLTDPTKAPLKLHPKGMQCPARPDSDRRDKVPAGMCCQGTTGVVQDGMKSLRGGEGQSTGGDRYRQLRERK